MLLQCFANWSKWQNYFSKAWKGLNWRFFNPDSLEEKSQLWAFTLFSDITNHSTKKFWIIFSVFIQYRYVIDGYACSLVFKGQNALLQAIEIADMQKYQRRKEVNKCGGYSETSTVHTTHHTTKFKWHGYLRRTTRLGLGIDLPQRNSKQQRQRPDGGAARLGYARASSRKTRPNQRDKFG